MELKLPMHFPNKGKNSWHCIPGDADQDSYYLPQAANNRQDLRKGEHIRYWSARQPFIAVASQGQKVRHAEQGAQCRMQEGKRVSVQRTGQAALSGGMAGRAERAA